MSHLTLFLTELCTKNCSYCDISKIKKKKSLNINLLREYYDLINNSNYDKIVLTGGEPGILKDNILFEILTNIKKSISINTNGEFIKRGYFDKYYEYISELQYHPVTEINEDINPYVIDKKIRYRIPVHKLNMHILFSFLDKYKQINFDLGPYDSKNVLPYLNLNKDDFKILFEIIKDKNITDRTFKIFERLSKLNDLTKLREICFNKEYIYPSIDFVNGTIKKCICSHTRSDSVQLTPDNFINMTTNSLNFNSMVLCDTCYQVCYHFDKLIRRLI